MHLRKSEEKTVLLYFITLLWGWLLLLPSLLMWCWPWETGHHWLIENHNPIFCRVEFVVRDNFFLPWSSLHRMLQILRIKENGNLQYQWMFCVPKIVRIRGPTSGSCGTDATHRISQHACVSVSLRDVMSSQVPFRNVALLHPLQRFWLRVHPLSLLFFGALGAGDSNAISGETQMLLDRTTVPQSVRQGSSVLY